MDLRDCPAVTPPSLVRYIATRARGEASGDVRPIHCHPHFLRRLRVARRLQAHRGCVNTAAWTPDALCVITGSDDVHLALWDATTWRLRARWPSLHVANIFCAKLLGRTVSAGSRIASCALDGQVRLHTVVSDRVVSSSVLFQHYGPAHKLSVSPIDDSTVISGGEDGVVARFDVRQPPQSRAASVLLRLQNAAGDRARCFFVDYHCGGQYLLVGGDLSLVCVYDLRRATAGPVVALPERLRPYSRSVLASGGQWRTDGLEFCASFNDAFAATFAFTGKDVTDEEGRVLPPADVKAPVLDSPSRTPAARRLTSAPPGLSYETGARVHEKSIFRFHRNCQTIKGIAYMGARGEWVVSGCDSGNVVFYSRADGCVRHVATGDRRGAVNCIAPHPGHLPLLITSGLEHDAKVWRPDDSSPCVSLDQLSSWCRRAGRTESIDPADWRPAAELETDSHLGSDSDGSTSSLPVDSDATADLSDSTSHAPPDDAPQVQLEVPVPVVPVDAGATTSHASSLTSSADRSSSDSILDDGAAGPGPGSAAGGSGAGGARAFTTPGAATARRATGSATGSGSLSGSAASAGDSASDASNFNSPDSDGDSDSASDTGTGIHSVNSSESAQVADMHVGFVQEILVNQGHLLQHY